jgi:hypothetical protein
MEKMMTLDEATAQIESRLPAQMGTPSYRSQTGETYTIIVSGGVKDEGQAFPALCATEEIAVRLWLEAMNAYLEGKEGTLYWRERPQLASDEDQFSGRYVVYSRLLVSDKPVLVDAAA